MAPSDTNISKIHTILLGLTGLSCLLYAILAVTQNTPQPIWWFVAIAMGVFAGISTFVAFAMADPASRRMATDEMYTLIRHRAQRHAYWLSLGLYPVFAVIIMMTGFEWNTVFAAMGTLTSAAYLLLLTFYEWRMS
ncbi:hypothetical protein N9R02_01630 [Ascidiaceihabitans sp.]|nr:hypothetical protein [Ascidiaceihabitans sp.]